MFTPIAFVGALWRRDFKTVARYAHIRAADGDPARVEELARQRTRPIGAAERSGWTARLDGATGGIMAWLLLTSFHSCGLSRNAETTALVQPAPVTGPV